MLAVGYVNPKAALSSRSPMKNGARIGFLTSSYPRFEGDLSGHFVENTAEILNRTGYRLLVMAPHEPGIPGSETKRGIPIERFRYAWPASLERVAYGSGIMANLRGEIRARLALPGFLLALVLAARRLSGRSDLIHAHWIPCGLAALLASGRQGPPVIVTILGSDMTLARRSALVRRILNRAASIVAVSEAMRTELIALGLHPDRIVVVRLAMRLSPPPHGDRATLRRRAGLEERTTLLFLGRLSHVKGPDVLMDAVSRGLLEETNSQLVFLGGGNMEASLREAARSIPSGRIHFAGSVPHGEVPQWLGACDLLVMPSRSEGLPVALIEALSFGIPVVASSVGGIPEIVNAGNSGWLVPPEDPIALEKALRDALADSPRREQKGESGRALVKEGGFESDRMGDDLNLVYSAALSLRRAARTAADATSSQSNR
jgi:phosphatidylinositol alpha-1,6-mannosyltransferase